jgi:hypothetical protein
MVGGARDPTQFALLGPCEALAWWLTAPALVDPYSTTSLHSGAGLACPDTCDVNRPSAPCGLEEPRVENAPTSDVSMVVPRAPREPAPAVAQLTDLAHTDPSRGKRNQARCLTRRTKPAAHGPRKGHICFGPRRLQSCSDMLTGREYGLLHADLECSARSMAHRFALTHAARVASATKQLTSG